jgi:hypothetical protein
MYSKAVEEEDNKMVGCWQKDADCIFIFVSPCVRNHVALCVNWNIMDQFNRVYLMSQSLHFLLSRCGHSGLAAKQSEYLCILSWEGFLLRDMLSGDFTLVPGLVMSLSCLPWATSLHQWVPRYIRLTRPAQRCPGNESEWVHSLSMA